MATADQIKALLRSHLEGDDERFYSIALQVAAHAARQGHGRFAQELRKLIEDAASKASAIQKTTGPVPIAQPRGDLAGLLNVDYAETRMADMVLTRDVEARIDRVLREQRHRDKLLAHGLAPRRKLLLVGPPGSGKTMTAAALAGELKLPLFTIQLDGLITKFMGETAGKLRLLFDAIARTRGVYLFDEFDAIGGHRSAGNDVGEIRRVLNSFLQFLEQDTSDSLIVAATNHPELLDKALFRRFDDVIEYSLPGPELVERTFLARLFALDTSSIDWSEVVKAANNLSYAEIVRASEDAAKDTILEDRKALTTAGLLRAISERIAIRQ